MCLLTSKKFPSVSLKPIKVYKVFVKCADGGLYSPYRFKKYDSHGRIVAESKRITSNKKIFSSECGAVGEGYVFAYTDIELARELTAQISRYTDYDTCILECNIPIGTLFFVDDCGEICAKKMNIIKEI